MAGPRIVVYSDQRARTATAGLLPALQDAFNEQAVHTAETEDFRREIEHGQSSVIVIPGICGEESRYFDLLGGEEGQRKLENFVRRGGVLVSICAGSYLIAKDTIYTPPWDREKTRTNCAAIFNAAARGPLVHHARKPVEHDGYDDCSLINVRYKAGDGSWQETGILYGNGPALFPYEEDPDMEVLARYADIPGQPIAAAWKPLGKGAALWLGVLPYIGYEPVIRSPATEKIYGLMEELKPHDAGRLAFWNELMARVRSHAGSSGGPSHSPLGLH